MNLPPQSDRNTPADQDSLIEFPCSFPIKVVGVNDGSFAEVVAHIACQFDPEFDHATCMVLRESSGGKYLGATITVMATSREQLDELYQALSTHPLARWVL